MSGCCFAHCRLPFGCTTAVLVARRRLVPACDSARRHGADQLVTVSRSTRQHAAARRVSQLQRSVVDVACRRWSAALSQATSGRTRRRKGAARFSSEVRFSTRTQKYRLPLAELLLFILRNCDSYVYLQPMSLFKNTSGRVSPRSTLLSSKLLRRVNAAEIWSSFHTVLLTNVPRWVVEIHLFRDQRVKGQGHKSKHSAGMSFCTLVSAGFF